MKKTQVVILGAGYGGLYTALKLERLLKRRQHWKILLIDQNDYHQLKTELYGVVAKKKTFEAVTVPFRNLLKHKRISFMHAKATHIEFAQKIVMTTQGKVKYDELVIAVGSETEFFGIPGLKEHTFTLESMEDAQRIRSHIQKMFTHSAYEADEKVRRTRLTFVVGGGGFTGVELATELADYIAKLAKEADIGKEEPRLIVVEAGGSVLPGFDFKLVNRASQVLKSKGTKLMLKTPVVAFEGNTIQLKTGEEIQTKTLIWTGGVRANALVAKSGLKCGPRGRVVVNPFLESVDYAGVYVVGDNSLVLDSATGRPLAPTAQLALQQAETVAFNIYAELTGKRRKRFTPKVVGQFVSLGRHEAVGWVWKFRISGFLAWFLKRLSVLRYLYSIGGLKLMIAKLLQLLV
ncbi:MAG: NAD(P)/FAD-dependent oxidoreductase [Candidatus Bathyarchaeia archaeon]